MYGITHTLLYRDICIDVCVHVYVGVGGYVWAQQKHKNKNVIFLVMAQNVHLSFG